MQQTCTLANDQDGAATNSNVFTTDAFGASSLWNRRISQAIWGFIALGVVLRLTRYLVCFPLWGDEAYLAVNFPDRGYLELIRPLDYGQVCPILFLWIELTCVKLFGLSEWSLRLFPCICGLASLFLFKYVAEKVVRGVPLLLAVAVFSVSYYPIRHGAEVKPYASDLLVTLGLLALAIAWLESPSRTRWLWMLAAVVPGALAISYPAVFVAGGISLTIFITLWRDPRRADWIPFVIYNASLVGTFVGLFAIVTGTQYESSVEAAGTLSYWGKRFPPLDQPLHLLVWLVVNHTGRFFAYPIGDDNGASAVTFICFAIGAAMLWSRRQRIFLALCLAPFALNFVAAAIQRYPYGGSGRIAQHLVPMICLLSGIGAAGLLARLGTEKKRQRGILALSVGLAIFGAGIWVADLVRPYKHDYDKQVRDLAATIWVDQGRDAELVCVSEQLQEPFATAALANTGAARAQYLCNQRFCAAKRRNVTSAPRWDLITADHPLRCVLFRVPDQPRDQAGIADWLTRMQSRFAWVGYEKHELPCYYRRWKTFNKVRFEIYEFTPKPGSASEAPQPLQLTFDPKSPTSVK